MTTPFPFVSGAVLTAAQMNAITEVPVSAKTASYTLAATDAGSRITMNSASATTITVNTGLFTAGQSLSIQNLNGGGVCTVTAGTATVTSAGPLAIPSWGGGQLYFTSASAAVWFPAAVTATASGLTLVSATTIGSAVSSVTVSNAFSATYDSYRIIISGGVGSTLQSIAMILGASVTGYYMGKNQVKYSSAGQSLSSDNNAASWTAAGVSSTSAIAFDNTLINPFLAKTTGIAGVFGFHDTAGDSREQGGFHNVATSYTGFTISVAGTLTGGTIRVYGYANS